MTKFKSVHTDNPIRDPLIRSFNYDEESTQTFHPSLRKEEEVEVHTPWQTLYDTLDLTSLPMTILIVANLVIFMYDTNYSLIKFSLWVILLTQISLYILLAVSHNFCSIKNGNNNENDSVLKNYLNNRTPIEVWCTELTNLICSILSFALIWTSKDFNGDYNLAKKHIPISYLLKILFSILISIEFIHPCFKTDSLEVNGREKSRNSCTSVSFSLGTSICLKELLSRIFFRFLVLIVIFIYTFYIISHSGNINNINDLKEIHYIPPTVILIILISTIMKIFNKTYGFYSFIHYFFTLVLFGIYTKKALNI